MKYTLSELEKFQENRFNFKGNELNRVYWANRLADAFPQVTERKNGEVETIKFMGVEFVRRDKS